MIDNAIWHKNPGGMKVRIWAVLVGEYIVMAVILFTTAGTVSWTAGWVFIGLFAVTVTPMSVSLANHDPQLIEERMKILPQENQPIWDRMLLALLIVLIGLWLVVPGFDAIRYGWSAMPFWLRLVGGVGMVITLWANFTVMRQNSYLAPTVQVQSERGHTVVTTGAYGLVRHPFYATLSLFFLAGALLLGSWISVMLAFTITLVFAWRCVREEAHLRQNLEGYAAYMEKVRYRLVPHVW
ncbi:isoprenylcysteine carboxylmethyltransferase family protein [Hoeflea sp. TYP-13]|uniref:isoprenylcysteine carboxylmethyltransferase family protein n=1 Tax=Hoeflea sp. TYP-13 TaxID=3230023 RepID=UPI0034C65A66